MSELVIVETVDRVRTITMHRPEARNALNVALQHELGSALLGAEADDGVDIMVLTGSDPAFCAGLDLRELADGGKNLVGVADDARVSPFAALWKAKKPVIGAINGACVTGGFELALACDFLVASDLAFFGDTHARVGVMPAGGMSVFLPATVGVRRAKEMSLTGNFLSADDALRTGLVNHVVPHAELMTTAQKLGTDIAGNDQAAVRNLKKLYDANELGTAGDGLAQEQKYFRAWRLDPAEIGRRRETVIGRGQSQTG